MPENEARVDRPLHVLRALPGLIAQAAKVAADVAALVDGASEAEIERVLRDSKALAEAIGVEVAWAKSHRSEARQAQIERAAAKAAAESDEAEDVAVDADEPKPANASKRKR